MDVLIQLNFYTYLKLNDYINLLLTNKIYYNNYNNDSIYKYYLKRKFSENFIEKAKPIIISYYDCFHRISIFENIVIKEGFELWEEDIYYLFWKVKYRLCG
tara:strand:- start:19371 stop:19673 length:303 start_codon:yes stop_codon:yes gene_type:complete